MNAMLNILDDVLFSAAMAGIDVTTARAELAQLRATVAEQARQLEAAGNIIAAVSLEADDELDNPTIRRYAIDRCDAWLAANPAPEAAQKTGMEDMT